MKRTLRAWAGAVLILAPTAGCETFGARERRPTIEEVAGGFEPEAPEGAKGQAKPARLGGAWSSEASEIEDGLLRRKADPNYPKY